MTAFYDEIDATAAHVMREQIVSGVIAPGVVSEVSIKDLTADDVRDFTQAHFFAGGGLWSVAARLAGWPDDLPLWTGSCPCQPFSQAGKQKGFDDDRDLWPEWFRLIRECRPPVIAGEQVASASKAASPTQIRSIQNVQELRDRQALVDVLQGLEYSGPEVLKVSGLSGIESETEQGGPRQGVGAEGQREKIAPQEQNDKTWLLFSEGSEEARGIEGDSLQSGRLQERDTEPGICGILRNDGHPVQSSDGEGAHMEQPFTGSNPSRIRLRDIECSGRSVLSECDDERLGRGEATGSGGGSEKEEARAGGSTTQLYSEPEGQAEPDWLDRVFNDLEGEGYAVRAIRLAACSVDAPHIRNRIYWVAVDDTVRVGNGKSTGEIPAGWNLSQHANGSRAMAHADGGGRTGRQEDAQRGTERRAVVERPDDVGHAAGERRGEGRPEPSVRSGRPAIAGADAPIVLEHAGSIGRAEAFGSPSDSAAPDGEGATDRVERFRESPRSYWRDSEWIICHDGKARRTKPGLRLLSNGVFIPMDALRREGITDVPEAEGDQAVFRKGRVELWRIAGNAIVPILAAEVLGALLDTLRD